MKEPLNRLHSHHALQQYMRSEHIILGERVRIAKRQVHVRLRGQMEDGVDVVLSQTAQHIGRLGDVSVEEFEIGPGFEHARVVERTAVVELVEADDVVGGRVFGDEVADQPGCTGGMSVWRFQRLGDLETNMKPSPPVTMMLRTSGNGVKDPWPVSMGASFHRPSSTKKRDSKLPAVPSVFEQCFANAASLPPAFHPAVDSGIVRVRQLWHRKASEGFDL